MKNSMISLLAVSFAGPALAQTNATYLLTSSNTVNPSSPTTTVKIWATWERPAFEFGIVAANYDLSAGDGLFSNAVNVLNGPASSTGVITGNLITGAINGQLNLAGFPVQTDNPMLLATYDWTTTDFMPRAVDLFTSNTSIFTVFNWMTGQLMELFPREFTPGSGVIIVEAASKCYADCDPSTGLGVLDLLDFLCFQNSFVNGEPYACDCDITTGTNPPVCDLFDFLCFQSAFVNGCP